MQNRGLKLKSPFLFLIVIFIFTLLIWRSWQPKINPNLDNFAKCLTEKGVIMYGAYWCPHCKNEKAAFGDSFKYINYVECTKQVNECIAADIKGYPTWILGDGVKLVGEQGVEKLSEFTGCSL